MVTAAPTVLNQVDPLRIPDLAVDRTDEIPDIVEFVVSDKWLNRPNLYPRQATLLKVLFLQDDLFTAYDYDVLAEWATNYLRTKDSSGYGNNGIQPDILERIRICKEQLRRWFREFVFVGGRRGSKGYTGALAMAYVLWHFLAKSDPQGHYGIDRSKQLGLYIFAAKKQQAKEFQWKDLRNVIIEAPCFTAMDGFSYVSRNLEERLTVYAPWDIMRMWEMVQRGTDISTDMATFTIEPKESTLVSARGPALFELGFDEMAHVEKGVAKADAGAVYEQATPALDQFGLDGFIYEASSPWQKTGKFYENYEKSVEMNDDGSPIYPEVMMVQLASWDLYRDWDRAHTLPFKPVPPSIEVREYAEKIGGRAYFFPLKRAISSYDAQMQQEEKANPDTFRVERRAHWANVLDAYLDPAKVDQMWEPWPDPEGSPFEQQHRGILARTYRAHGDPSKSGARFAFSIAHPTEPDEHGLPHVVFDVIHAWDPADFEGGTIDYNYVETELEGYISRFMPAEVTFDQFSSVGTIQRLQRFARKSNLAKRVMVYERPATHPLNWRTYETFKTALYLGLVHGPRHDMAHLELTFLQDLGGKVDHPDSGPVQTKDIADCYHPDTEVLTLDGWKRVADVDEGEMVATRTVDGAVEYQPVLDRIERHHDGVLYEYQGRDLAFSVTPTHQMLVHQRANGTDAISAPVRSLTKPVWVPRTADVEHRSEGVVDIDGAIDRSAALVRKEGRGGAGRRWSEDEDDYLRRYYSTASMVDLCADLNRCRGAIYSRAKKLGLKRGQIGDCVADWPDALPVVKRVDFARFLGFWLAEGSNVSRSAGYGVRISQKKQHHIEWFDELIERMGWPHTREEDDLRGITWSISSRGLREYLRALEDGHELSIPREVFETWSRSEMEGLLEGLCRGDGTADGRGDHGYVGYSSSSRQLVDDVQRLLAHIGLVGNIRKSSTPPGRKVIIRGREAQSRHQMWSVAINAPLASDGAKLDPSRIEQVSYSGPVHCLTVQNHTLLTRLDDKPMWCGNCIAITVYELIGDFVAPYLSGQFEFAPRGSQQAGFDPYSQLRRESPVVSKIQHESPFSAWNRSANLHRRMRGSRPPRS